MQLKFLARDHCTISTVCHKGVFILLSLQYLSLPMMKKVGALELTI